MRIYFDATRNEIHVDATVDVWPARSLAVRIVPSGLMVYKANAGVDVLGPLSPSMVQQANGTSFSDQQAALLYLQGEFAKARDLGLGYPFVSSTAWLIPHGINGYPSVTTMDTTGEVIFGTTVYVDSNNLIVRFTYPVSGIAYLN